MSSDHRLRVVLSPQQPLLRFWSVQPTFINRPLRIEAHLEQLRGDGVIASHSGHLAGYDLYIREGLREFAIMDVAQPLRWDRLIPQHYVVTSAERVPVNVKVVEASIDLEGEVTLKADGQVIGRGTSRLLQTHPLGYLQMGKASIHHTPAGRFEPPFPLNGKVTKVIIDHGGAFLGQ